MESCLSSGLSHCKRYLTDRDFGLVAHLWCIIFFCLSCVISIRGVYLAPVFYHKDSILVTAEYQIPLVEIQCCSTSIAHDFFWFAKVSCRSNAGRELFMHVISSLNAIAHNNSSWWSYVSEFAFFFFSFSCPVRGSKFPGFSKPLLLLSPLPPPSFRTGTTF